MQCPEPTQPHVDILRVAKHVLELLDCPRVDGGRSCCVAATLRRPMLQDRPRLRGMPDARSLLQRGQRDIVERFQVGVAIHEGPGGGGLGGDPVDAAGVRMLHLGAADVGVVPVEGVDRAIRADVDAEADPVLVVGEEKLVAVPADVATPLPLEDIGEDGVLVNVGHEDAATIWLGKRIRLINPCATVRRGVGVVGDRADVGVDVRAQVTAALAVIDATGNDMPEVRNHACRDKELALGVVIDAPGVAEPVRHDLEAVLHRVVAPHAAIDLHGRFGIVVLLWEGLSVLVDPAFAHGAADVRRCCEALEPVEPAVGTPDKTVERFMTVGDAPTRQADLDCIQVSLVVSVAVGHEEQIGGRTEHESAETNRDCRRKRDALEKHLSAVGRAIVVGVLEDHDSASAVVGKTAAAGLVVPILGNPHPTSGVEAECKGLADHRLSGEEARAESWRHRHRPDRLVGGEEFRRPCPLLGLLPVCRPGHGDFVSSRRDPAGKAEDRGTGRDNAVLVSWRPAHGKAYLPRKAANHADSSGYFVARDDR